MKATIKKSTVSTEQIELIQEKKELKKLTKIIEKTPSKKEIKAIQKNEYMSEINNLDFELSSETLALINDNLEISETMKQLRKKQLNNSKYIFMNINNELLSLKNSIDSNKDYKHIEFTKKGIINLLRIKLNTKKMAKDLSSSLHISMDYLSYNLSLNLEFATINDIKSIIKAYEMSINGVNEYKSITKNRIAKAKNEATIKDLLNDIKEANKKFKTNEDARIKEENDKKVIENYLAKQDKKVA